MAHLLLTMEAGVTFFSFFISAGPGSHRTGKDVRPEINLTLFKNIVIYKRCITREQVSMFYAKPNADGGYPSEIP